MRRTNTASPEMIKDFAELKKRGVTEFFCTASIGDRILRTVTRKTAQGVSSFVNMKMFAKYGDAVTVEVGYFDRDCIWHNYCIYGA